MEDSAHKTPVAEPSLGKSALSPEQRAAIKEELRQIVESEAFRSSKRCQEFLTHIVERAMAGHEDLLKERTIGAEFFHRGPSYEPNSDAIVRVRATEVRKRLTQYYDHAGVHSRLRITLAPGSYVPEFGTSGMPGAPAMSARKGPGWRIGIAVAGCVLLAGVAAWLMATSRKTAVEAFWAPDLAAPGPVLICLRQPVVYHLSRRLHESYMKITPHGQFPSPYALPLKAGEVNIADIVPVPDQYVTVGTMQVASRLSALFASHRKAFRIRVGSNFSFVDLRESPAVLVGAVPHEWTEKLTSKLPFVLVQEGTRRGIREQDGAHRTWFVDSLKENGQTNEDYAVVTRIFLPESPGPLIALAGVTQYGSDAASELITDEGMLGKALVGVPADWSRRNLQILMRLNVIGKVPGKPEVVARRVW
ncbi:MAG: hypothetical protein JNL98_03645 [Bryobacterales bacterium]|nr:hypothetical protein [Bryobacterales bacterium]